MENKHEKYRKLKAYIYEREHSREEETSWLHEWLHESNMVMSEVETEISRLEEW